MSTYRARSSTELLDAAFQLIRANASGFFTLSAVIMIGSFVLQLLTVGTMQAGLQPGATATPTSFGFGKLFLFYVLISAWNSIFQAAMYLATQDAFLGRPIDVADTIKRGLPRALPLFVAFLVIGVFVGIGFLFLVIPGIIVACFLFAVPPVTVYETAGLGTALARSAALSNGLKGHVFWTSFLTIILLMVAYIILIYGGFTLAKVTGSPMATSVIFTIGYIFIFPVFPVVNALLYFDARIRKEGYDIELMAGRGGAAAAPSAS